MFLTREKNQLSGLLSDPIPGKNISPNVDLVVRIKLAEIKENSLQPRSVYDDNKLSDLILSIKEKGVLQPILVRSRDNGYEVIAGERRLRAARALGMEEVPVIVKSVNDGEALVLALVENIQREDLNAIEEARAFNRLILEFNFTQEKIAQSVGKDRSTVSNILRLLKLPKEIQESVFDGRISEGHARALLGVENAHEQKKIFEETVTKSLSVRELENMIRFSGDHRRGKRKFHAKDSYLIALEEDLQKALGTKVRILAQKKRGKIVVEYYSPDDLERIRGIIKK